MDDKMQIGNSKNDEKSPTQGVNKRSPWEKRCTGKVGHCNEVPLEKKQYGHKWIQDVG